VEKSSRLAKRKSKINKKYHSSPKIGLSVDFFHDGARHEKPPVRKIKKAQGLQKAIKNQQKIS